MQCNVEPDQLPTRDKGKDPSSTKQAIRIFQFQEIAHDVKGKLADDPCFSSRVLADSEFDRIG
jgi:hypothetical protein